jgi:hypothetical protein
MKSQLKFQKLGDLDKHSDAMVKLQADIAEAIHAVDERQSVTPMGSLQPSSSNTWRRSHAARKRR